MENKKIFLDFGTHKGEGLLEFFNNGTINETFEVHTFEACPDLDSLNEIKEKIKDMPNFPKNINFYNKAAWIEDGFILFNNRKDHASHIENIGFSYFQDKENFNTIKVESIDISEFINVFSENTFIVCKMDIEGSEFSVLRHLVKTNSIKKINEIYIEFHPDRTNNGTLLESDQTISILIQEMKECNNNLQVNLWH